MTTSARKRAACVKAGLARKAQLGPGGYSKLGQPGRPRKVKPIIQQRETKLVVARTMPELLKQVKASYKIFR